MLWTIIEKEIRDLVSSTKFVVTFGVCAFLILLSFYIGGKNYQVAVSQYQAAQAENVRQMEGLTDWFSIEQHRIFLPPQPLASLVSGISNDIGRTTEVKTRGELSAQDSRYNEEPIFAVFRFLDLSFVFQIVLSLFAILLGYNAISGEKERGTLRLSLSNAVPRSKYILGKLLGSFITLATSLVVALGLGCLLLPILGITLSGEEWTRLLIIIISGILYFGVFLSVSVFVSSLTERASSSFMILLVIWIGGVLVMPRVSILLAGRAVDVPSIDALASQKASYASGLWKDFRDGMKSFEAPPFDENTDIDAVMATFNQYMDSLTEIRDDKMDLFTGKLNSQRQNKQREQEKVAFYIARLSPSASLALATSELAGTSISLKNKYYDQATHYREKYNDFMKEKTGMNIGGRMVMWKTSDDEEEKPEPIDPTEMPAFEFANDELKVSVASSFPDIGLLIIFNLIFFAGSIFAFARYDVR